MICKWCAKCADADSLSWEHRQFGEVAELQGFTCKGGTHCDCQHKEPGTALDRTEFRRNEWLAKRINEGLPLDA